MKEDKHGGHQKDDVEFRDLTEKFIIEKELLRPRPEEVAVAHAHEAVTVLENKVKSNLHGIEVKRIDIQSREELIASQKIRIANKLFELITTYECLCTLSELIDPVLTQKSCDNKNVL